MKVEVDVLGSLSLAVLIIKNKIMIIIIMMNT